LFFCDILCYTYGLGGDAFRHIVLPAGLAFFVACKLFVPAGAGGRAGLRAPEVAVDRHAQTSSSIGSRAATF
jgi:hypothetical protein